MNSRLKNFIIWSVLFFALSILINLINNGGASKNILFSEFINRLEKGEIFSAEIQQEKIRGKYKNGLNYVTIAPIYYQKLYDKLIENNVDLKINSQNSLGNIFLNILISWFPLFLFIGIWLYLKKAGSSGKGSGGGGASSLLFGGRTNTKVVVYSDIKITFADVAGINEAKEELSEIVDFLKNPEKYKKLGAKVPKGCLLLGNPGTGKTLLAKAVAGEAKVPFFSIAGSDFVEMFVGVGASRVRGLFEQAKKAKPSIIFIDEIDAVGRHRGNGIGGGNDEREQTLNQLLVEMDGFEENENVIVIAASNRSDVLDKALMRPGRFDRQVIVANPDIKGREEILKVHMKKITASDGIDNNIIARGTPGLTGADLANIVNEAALYAAKTNKKLVTMEDIEHAKDKVLMGVERKSSIIKEDEKKLTAYHEAGHALVSIKLDGTDPIHKATIIPRGQALGMVMRLPTDDKYSVTRKKLLADLAVAMAGRAAEELIFGYDYVTTGASSDISYATNVASSMVKYWGLNDKVGCVKHEISDKEFISNDKANIIDIEIKSIIDNAYNTATKLLKTNENELHILAKALIEFETLTGKEIEALLAGKTIRNNNDNKEITDRSSFTFVNKSDKSNIVNSKNNDSNLSSKSDISGDNNNNKEISSKKDDK